LVVQKKTKPKRYSKGKQGNIEVLPFLDDLLSSDNDLPAFQHPQSPRLLVGLILGWVLSEHPGLITPGSTTRGILLAIE
jgi:hypothetical protein